MPRWAASGGTRSTSATAAQLSFSRFGLQSTCSYLWGGMHSSTLSVLVSSEPGVGDFEQTRLVPGFDCDSNDCGSPKIRNASDNGSSG